MASGREAEARAVGFVIWYEGPLVIAYWVEPKSANWWRFPVG